jgi:hypothetical protein
MPDDGWRLQILLEPPRRQIISALLAEGAGCPDDPISDTALICAYTEPCEPALVRPAHVLSVGLDPRSGPTGRYSTGGNACDRLRRQRVSPAFQGVERSGRIGGWASSDELDDVP